MSTQRTEEPDLAQLPVLDLSLLDGDASSQQVFREQLRSVTHDVGFFYLVGHGIPDDVVESAFEEARAFFALPIEEKKRIEMRHSPHFRGYNRAGGELTQGKVDWREQIDVGDDKPAPDLDGAPDYMCLEGPNLWPSARPSFRTVFTDWADRCTAIGLRLMRAWAVALGAPQDIFDEAFAQDASTLMKVVRYPGRAERGQGVGEHQDPGALTMLMIEPGKQGLQVQYGDRWIDAPAMDNAFVINIGELLEYATDGYLKATMHRVVTPKEGQERLSIPFFFNPRLDAQVPQITLPPDLARDARGVSQDPNNVIHSTFGENLLKLRLRAHPDVAKIQHPNLVRRAADSHRQTA